MGVAGGHESITPKYVASNLEQVAMPTYCVFGTTQRPTLGWTENDH